MAATADPTDSSTSRAPAQASFLPNMQIVRFIAAVMVLVSHLIREIESKKIGDSFTNGIVHLEMPWASGVDLFFVVSGFLMFYLTRNHFGRPGYNFEFLKRRLIRVVPLYWLFNFVFAAVALAIPRAVHHGDVSLQRMIASLFFIPIQRDDGGFYPILALGWTLNYEMLFYFIFTFALIFARRIGVFILITAFSVSAAANFCGLITLPRLQFWTDPIILEFVFGLALAYLYIKSVRLSLATRILLVATGFGLLIAMGQFGIVNTETQTGGFGIPGAIWGGLPSALIVAGFMLGNQMRVDTRLIKALILGGDSSYALYLTHMFPMRVLSSFWDITGLRSGSAFFVAGLSLALAVSIGVFLWIEQPLLSFLRRRFEPTRSVLRA